MSAASHTDLTAAVVMECALLGSYSPALTKLASFLGQPSGLSPLLVLHTLLPPPGLVYNTVLIKLFNIHDFFPFTFLAFTVDNS